MSNPKRDSEPAQPDRCSAGLGCRERVLIIGLTTWVTKAMKSLQSSLIRFESRFPGASKILEVQFPSAVGTNSAMLVKPTKRMRRLLATARALASDERIEHTARAQQLLKLLRSVSESVVDEPVNDIWKDPSVKAALKDGRPAEDIAVLSCPKCGRWGYYNQGSHFWCRFCKQGWYCCNEGEEPPPDRQYLWLDGFTTLADTVTDTTDGYDNETRRGQTPNNDYATAG